MHPADLWVHGLVNGLTAPLLNSPVGRRRISRIPCVSSIEGRRYPGGELVNDYRSESFPDHRFSTAYHLIDDSGGAHQSLGLTGRFTGQQAHLFEVTCELRGWRKSTKPVHGKLLPIKTGSERRVSRAGRALFSREESNQSSPEFDLAQGSLCAARGDYWVERRIAAFASFPNGVTGPSET